jgi:hypothetical protein
MRTLATQNGRDESDSGLWRLSAAYFIALKTAHWGRTWTGEAGLALFRFYMVSFSEMHKNGETLIEATCNLRQDPESVRKYK